MVNSTIRRVATLAALAMILQIPPARAQIAAGTIQGTTVDPSGSAAPGVAITAINADTGARRETVTDSRGFFSVPGLAPGEYELVAVLPGFATLRQSGARVHAGRTLALRLDLRVAPAPETITLAGTPPAIERTQAHVSGIVEPAAMENMPARRRNALELAQLAPGVTRSVLTGEINFTALPAALTRVVVDGVDAIDGQFGQEAARELVVIPGAAPAEYGNAGATVHIVSRSGTSRLTGSAYEFFGHEALNSNTAVDERLGRPEPSYESNQFGGALGGPIVRNAHFFFGAFDGARVSEREQALDHDVFFLRSDHRLWGAGRATARYRHQNFTGGGTRAVNGSFATSIGASLFNDVRVQYGTGRQERDWIGDEATLDRLQVADTLAWVRGAHLLTGGADVLVDEIGGSLPGTTMPAIEEYAFFVQDEWRASEALTLSAGVRYDLQTFEEPTDPRTDTDNVGPRVGVAWSPTGRRYVVRGGYGLFYGRTPGARVQQGNAGVEWEWMPHTTFGVHSLFARGEGLPDVSALELPPAGPLTLPFARAIPAGGTAESVYNAISLEVSRRFAQNHAYMLSYTFGEAGVTATDSGNFHRFVGSTLYSSGALADRFDGLMQTLLEAWTLSAIYSAQTGAPGWNALDARAARDLEMPGDTRVTLIWEAFNLLNRANGSAIETRRVTGQNGPRAMQLAVKLSF